MTEEGPSEERGAFGFKVTTEEGLVVEISESRNVLWYAPEWDAQRVADLLAESASVWRVEQVAYGGVNSLDEEQVSTLEAGCRFFTLLAQMERGEHVPLEELAEAVVQVSRAADGVILETAWATSDET